MKITQEQQKQGQELYQQLVEKAWEDTNFKKQLITSPVDTIKTFSEGKVNFHNEVSVVVEDQSNQSIIYINIPKNVNIEDFELTEEQLEIVSGGSMFYDFGRYWGREFVRGGFYNTFIK